MSKMNSKMNWKAGFFCKCPSCGKGKLIRGMIKLHDTCPNCDEDFTKFETADGPAFFASAIIGTIVGIAAGIYEVVAEPSIWEHFALWVPATFIGSMIVIRITKGLMCAHQHHLGHQGMSQ